MSGVLIIPGNTDLNRGDQALVWASISLIKEVWPDVPTYIYSVSKDSVIRELQESQTMGKGVKFLERLLPHPGRGAVSGKFNPKNSLGKTFFWGVRAFWDLACSIFLLSRSRILCGLGVRMLGSRQLETFAIFPQLSAVVVKGGGFLHSHNGTVDVYKLYYFLFDIFLAKRHNVPVFILPNSIGPIYGWLGKFIVEKALVNVEVLYVRESRSKLYVEHTFDVAAHLAPDLAFFLESSAVDIRGYLVGLGVDFTRENIAVTVRPYRFDGGSSAATKYKRYLSGVAEAIDQLVRHKHGVCLVAHTLGPSEHENDFLAIQAIFELLPENCRESVVIVNEHGFTCEDMQELYGCFDYVIGTRFHSVIFALNKNVPALAIAYGGYKAHGIMQDAGLEHFVVDIEDVTGKKVVDLLMEASAMRNGYLEKLAAYRSQLGHERKRIVDALSISR